MENLSEKILGKISISQTEEKLRKDKVDNAETATKVHNTVGREVRKAIEEIRQQNESSGHKTYKTSLVNQERGKLTDKISPSGNLYPAETDPLAGAMATEKIGTQQLDYSGDCTELLSNIGSEETSVLSDMTVDTFVIEHEITFIHTEEIIGLEAN